MQADKREQRTRRDVEGEGKLVDKIILSHPEPPQDLLFVARPVEVASASSAHPRPTRGYIFPRWNGVAGQLTLRRGFQCPAPHGVQSSAYLDSCLARPRLGRTFSLGGSGADELGRDRWDWDKWCDVTAGYKWLVLCCEVKLYCSGSVIVEGIQEHGEIEIWASKSVVCKRK